MSSRAWMGAWLAILGGIAVLWLIDEPSRPVSVSTVSTFTETNTTSIPTIAVHVSGAVVSPGVVMLPTPARLADAVAAVGGAAPHADLANVNLAAPVGDGEHVQIPVLGELAPGAAGSESPVAQTDGPIRLNDATAEELQRIGGIGPVLAQRIIEFRAEHGPFAVVEDLLDVPGIGEGRLAGLRDELVVP